MGDSPPNLVDYLTLAAAVISPLIAAATTIWSIRHTGSELFDLDLTWRDYGPNSPLGEAPILVVHNRSSVKILVSEIWYSEGLFLKRKAKGTAKRWEDPTELNFPYEIEPNEVGRFILSESFAKHIYSTISPVKKAFYLVGQSSFWIGLRTTGGSQKVIPAERIIPWDELPNWLRHRT